MINFYCLHNVYLLDFYAYNKIYSERFKELNNYIVYYKSYAI